MGDLVLDKRGIARRGLLIRHLVLPDNRANTRAVAEWLAREISPNTYINVMSQYHPEGAVLQPASSSACRDIRRRLTGDEFRAALRTTREAGLHRFDKELSGLIMQSNIESDASNLRFPSPETYHLT